MESESARSLDEVICLVLFKTMGNLSYAWMEVLQIFGDGQWRCIEMPSYLPELPSNEDGNGFIGRMNPMMNRGDSMGEWICLVYLESADSRD